MSAIDLELVFWGAVSFAILAVMAAANGRIKLGVTCALGAFACWVAYSSLGAGA